MKNFVASLSSWFNFSQHSVPAAVSSILAPASTLAERVNTTTNVPHMSAFSLGKSGWLRMYLGMALFMGIGLSVMPQAHAFQGENEVIAKCNQGDLASCNMAAQGYLEEHNYAQAVTYLNKLCYSHSPDSLKACALEMTLLTDANYGINNIPEGVKVGEYLCQNQNSYGCLLLSSLYFNGNQIQQDLNKASDYAKIACQLKDATGCRQAALITFTAAYVLKDVNLAEESYTYHRAACNIGNQQSCADLQQFEKKIEEFKLYAATPANNQPAAPAPAPKQ